MMKHMRKPAKLTRKSRTTVGILVSLCLVLTIAIPATAYLLFTNIVNAQNTATLPSTPSFGGGILNVSNDETAKDVAIDANSSADLSVANHLAQTADFGNRFTGFSSELVEVTVRGAKMPGTLIVNSVAVNYSAGDSQTVLPLMVPNSGVLTIHTTANIYASARVISAYQNPQGTNSQGKAVVSPGGTLITTPADIPSSGASEATAATEVGVSAISVYADDEIATPSARAYQNIRNAYLLVTAENQTVKFYNPSVNEQGISETITTATKPLATAKFGETRESKTLLVPVDFYGRIVYSGEADIQLLGVVQDSNPALAELDAEGAEGREPGEVSGEPTNTQNATVYNQGSDTPAITINQINDGKPVDLAVSPYLLLSGDVAVSGALLPKSIMLYANGEVMGSATMHNVDGAYKWLFYTFLGAENATITAKVTYFDEREASANADLQVIVPDTNATIIQPNTKTVSPELAQRLISADDNSITVRGLGEVTTDLYDAQGNVIQANSPIHVGDVLAIGDSVPTDAPGVKGILRRILGIYTEAGNTILSTQKVEIFETVVQASRDVCTPISNDSISGTQTQTPHSGDNYQPSGDANYDAMRGEYTDPANFNTPEPDLNKAPNCQETYSGEAGASASNVNTMSDAIGNADVINDTSTPSHDINLNPSLAINIPLQASIRLGAGVCTRSNPQVCAQGRGQLDFGINLRLKLGFRFELDAKVNWKYVAAAIAAGVAVFIAVMVSSFGFGWTAAVIAALATVAGVCYATSCIEVSHFRVGVVYGYELVGGFSVSGKATVKVSWEINRVTLAREVAFLGPIPVEGSIEEINKLDFEVYASYTAAQQWKKSLYKESGKVYDKDKGWSSYSIETQNPDDDGETMRPSSFVQYGIALIPIGELSAKVYEIFGVYVQIRPKFEYMVVTPGACLPVNLEKCKQTGDSPWAGLRFTLSLRIGLKAGIDTKNFKWTPVDVSEDTQLFQVTLPLWCYGPDGYYYDCKGMKLTNLPAIDGLADDSAITTGTPTCGTGSACRNIINDHDDQILASFMNVRMGKPRPSKHLSSRYDAVYNPGMEQWAKSLSTEQVIYIMAEWAKQNDRKIIPEEVELISNFTAKELETLLAGQPFEKFSCDFSNPEYGNYEPDADAQIAKHDECEKTIYDTQNKTSEDEMEQYYIGVNNSGVSSIWREDDIAHFVRTWIANNLFHDYYKTLIRDLKQLLLDGKHLTYSIPAGEHGIHKIADTILIKEFFKRNFFSMAPLGQNTSHSDSTDIPSYDFDYAALTFELEIDPIIMKNERFYIDPYRLPSKQDFAKGVKKLLSDPVLMSDEFVQLMKMAMYNDYAPGEMQSAIKDAFATRGLDYFAFFNNDQELATTIPQAAFYFAPAMLNTNGNIIANGNAYQLSEPLGGSGNGKVHYSLSDASNYTLDDEDGQSISLAIDENTGLLSNLQTVPAGAKVTVIAIKDGDDVYSEACTSLSFGVQ